MTSWWSTRSIRVRLTAWYAVVLGLMMMVYAAATFGAVRHEFFEQFDDQLHEDFESAEGFLAPAADGRVTWSGDGRHDPDNDEDRGSDVWLASGEQVYRSGASSSLPPVALASTTAQPRYESITANGQRWRTLTGTTLVGGRAVGYALARRALTPIDHLATDARRITADRLHERLSVPNQHDEIGQLAAVINDAFARLESSFEQLRRFTADASHELRTPLAVIRGLGEGALGKTRTPDEYKEVMGSMLEEVDRLTNLVDTLLRLSHGDAGTVRLARSAVDVGELASEAVSSLGILAEERNQRVTVDAAEGVVVSADRLVLREAITNVVDNAIKYSPPASSVRIRVYADGGEAHLTVADEGPGIAAQDRQRIFDRFFRLDEGRSRASGGAGLGLAIAKWAVEVNGGRISVDTGANSGSVFHIVLPIRRSPIAADSEHTTQRMGEHV
ncbi:MAG: hypothetical protein DMF93_20240 [Acidobacteria bacterium]|nr:MAG: hypothetical protein DMF93_20240 [Acidobacteriota bacterium]